MAIDYAGYGYLARLDAIKALELEITWCICKTKPSITLSNLIMHCLEQQGKLSSKRRDQYRHKVPDELFDAMEKAYTELFDD